MKYTKSEKAYRELQKQYSAMLAKVGSAPIVKPDYKPYPAKRRQG